MIGKKFLSMALLLAATGTAFVASEQSAEAARCCRQRCHRNRRCCGSAGYGYAYGGSYGCNTCNMAPGTNQGTSAVPAPATDAPAPPPAPST